MKSKKFAHIFLSGLFTFLLAFVGQSVSFAQEYSLNKALTDKIDSVVKAYDDVSVKMDKGSVILSGKVATQEQKDTLMRSVQEINGVPPVKDEIHVASSSDSTPVEEYLDDTAITASIKGKMLTQKGLDSLDISVKTEDGIVTLSGEVEQASQISLAEEVARQVKGVKRVDNMLLQK